MPSIDHDFLPTLFLGGPYDGQVEVVDRRLTFIRVPIYQESPVRCPSHHRPPMIDTMIQLETYEVHQWCFGHCLARIAVAPGLTEPVVQCRVDEIVRQGPLRTTANLFLREIPVRERFRAA